MPIAGLLGTGVLASRVSAENCFIFCGRLDTTRLRALYCDAQNTSLLAK
jgi:hypothetical protein